MNTTTNGASGAQSKATTSNPKDLVGAQKVSLTCISPFAMLHEAHSMHKGVMEYGPYNYRDKDIQARIYLDACMRHMLAWFEGEEAASDSGAHHLGHARACLGILLDAQATGHLIDDRPINESTRGVFAAALERVNGEIKARLAEADDPVLAMRGTLKGPHLPPYSQEQVTGWQQATGRPDAWLTQLGKSDAVSEHVLELTEKR